MSEWQIGDAPRIGLIVGVWKGEGLRFGLYNHREQAWQLTPFEGCGIVYIKNEPDKWVSLPEPPWCPYCGKPKEDGK